MPLHSDFQKIHDSMIQQYGEEKGKQVFYAWVNEHGCDETISMDANHKAGKCKVSRHMHSQLPFFPFVISERVFGTQKPLRITGVAAKTGLSRNLNYYSDETLKELSQKLVGAPVYAEHVSFFDAIGRVTKTWLDGDSLFYSADIIDDEAIIKIRNGLVRHVSVAADYESLDVVNGFLPSGFSNAELSLVAVAGIPETNIQIMESLRKIGANEPPTDDSREAEWKKIKVNNE